MPSPTVIALMAKHGVPSPGAGDEAAQTPPPPDLVDAMKEFIGHVHSKDAMAAAECFQTMQDISEQGEQPQAEDQEPDGDEAMPEGE